MSYTYEIFIFDYNIYLKKIVPALQNGINDPLIQEFLEDVIIPFECEGDYSSPIENLDQRIANQMEIRKSKWCNLLAGMHEVINRLDYPYLHGKLKDELPDSFTTEHFQRVPDTELSPETHSLITLYIGLLVNYALIERRYVGKRSEDSVIQSILNADRDESSLFYKFLEPRDGGSDMDHPEDSCDATSLFYLEDQDSPWRSGVEGIVGMRDPTQLKQMLELCEVLPQDSSWWSKELPNYIMYLKQIAKKSDNKFQQQVIQLLSNSKDYSGHFISDAIGISDGLELLQLCVKNQYGLFLGMEMW
jgi:hypothetical protein